MIVLDASCVIAHLNTNDPHHAAATRVLEQYLDVPLLIHSVNLAEVLIGGVRVCRDEEMLEDLQALGVTVAEPVANEPLKLAQLRISSGLKLPDCCALLVAIHHQRPLASFDNQLREAATKMGLSALPVTLSCLGQQGASAKESTSD